MCFNNAVSIAPLQKALVDVQDLQLGTKAGIGR